MLVIASGPICSATLSSALCRRPADAVVARPPVAVRGGAQPYIAVSRPILGRVDLVAGLNGAIAGLVSITAGPDITGHYWAIVIGAVGAVICTAAIKLLERLQVDDVVGAVPAHLFAGAWGTIATSIAAGADIGVQLLGVVSIGAFAFVTSWLTWLALEKTMGVRVSRKVEEMGQDIAELGYRRLSRVRAHAGTG